MPVVSVLTPSFGYARFISDAVQSVLRQSDVRAEHIIQDALSDDGTQEILASFGDGVRWWSEPDQGQSDALNKALSRASSPWIGWLNADEFYLPGALSRLMQFAESKRADVVYGDAIFVDEAGRFLRLVPQHRFSAFVLRSYGTYISSCTTLIRREAVQGLQWDTELRMLMDRDLYLRLHARGCRFRYLPCPIAAFRVHEQRVTARPTSEFADEYDRVGRAHRHSRSIARFTGRALHAFLKASGGSYTRQVRARNHARADLRWFASETAHDNAKRLVASNCTAMTDEL